MTGRHIPQGDDPWKVLAAEHARLRGEFDDTRSTLRARTSGRAGARVRRDAAQTIPNATWTAVEWDTVTHDLGGWFDAGAPTELVAPKAAIVTVAAGLRWEDEAAGVYRALALHVDGFTWSSTWQPVTGGGFIGPTCQIADTVAVDAGATLEIWVYQDSGGVLDTYAFPTANWFAATA